MTEKERFVDYCNRQGVPKPLFNVSLLELEEIEQNSTCLNSLVVNMFFLGCLRGYKAAKAEFKRNQKGVLQMETKKVASIEEAKQLFDRLDEKAQIAFAEYWGNQIKGQNTKRNPCDGDNHTQGHIKNITQSV